MAQPIGFLFFTKRCVTDILAIKKKKKKKKKNGEKSLPVLTGCAKNEMLGPNGPPLMHFSVKELMGCTWKASLLAQVLIVSFPLYINMLVAYFVNLWYLNRGVNALEIFCAPINVAPFYFFDNKTIQIFLKCLWVLFNMPPSGTSMTLKCYRILDTYRVRSFESPWNADCSIVPSGTFHSALHKNK